MKTTKNVHKIEIVTDEYVFMYFNEDDNSIGMVIDTYDFHEDKEFSDEELQMLQNWIDLRSKRK